MRKILKLILPVLVCVFMIGLCIAMSADTSAMTLREGAEAAKCDECPENLFGDEGGDAKKVTDAKNTVLYAIIGLVIAFLAFAIVNFVITSLPSA